MKPLPASELPTYTELSKLFNYDPGTGIITNRINRATNAKAGEEAGSLKQNGYRSILLNGEGRQTHRIAWLLFYGCWPTDELDHIDHVKDNNRITNLRPATRSENNRNASRRGDSTSGVTGVSWNRTRKKWCAYITFDGKRTHLGLYTDLQSAANARKEAERKHGFHINHGQFA